MHSISYSQYTTSKSHLSSLLVMQGWQRDWYLVSPLKQPTFHLLSSQFILFVHVSIYKALDSKAQLLLLRNLSMFHPSNFSSQCIFPPLAAVITIALILLALYPALPTFLLSTKLWVLPLSIKAITGTTFAWPAILIKSKLLLSPMTCREILTSSLSFSYTGLGKSISVGSTSSHPLALWWTLREYRRRLMTLEG